MVYKIARDLKVNDSLSVDAGKASADDFLQITSDTLHDFLNIYIQKKEKKIVRIIRLDKNLKQVADVSDVDVARLNAIAAFESEIFYYKKDVYTIRAVSQDSSGKQFFLNKYSLKAEDKNFEYEQKWQFPFERSNINSAHVVSADKQFVFLYVNVHDGAKKGQWVLKINAVSGTLIRGTKLTFKGDPGFYAYGKIMRDSTEGMIYAMGQKLSETELDQKENKFNILSKPAVVIYLSRIDSAGELLDKNEYKIPIVEPKGNKTPNSYLVRMQKLKKKDGNLSFDLDVYKGSNMGCYSYCNTTSHNLIWEEGFVLEKTSVSTNTLVEKYYFNKDKLDMNGKLCIDSLNEFEKFYYKSIPFEVKTGYKFDDLNNVVILLKKSDAKKAQDNYSILNTVNKNLLITRIDDINKNEEPGIIVLTKNQYLIKRQIAPGKFQLKIGAW
ncbi:MAG: hypothetical protein K0S32_1043 [Bacteroidetes bacterium]|nr:hypothetical protein [Bacteroidota bacterium]